MGFSRQYIEKGCREWGENLSYPVHYTPSLFPVFGVWLGRVLPYALAGLIAILIVLMMLVVVLAILVVFALLVGTVTGTYSSTFTAAPLLLVLDSLRSSKKK